jgi:hypothetical protein
MSSPTVLTAKHAGLSLGIIYLFSRLYDVPIFLRPFHHYAIFLLHFFLSVQSPACNPFSAILPLIPSAQAGDNGLGYFLTVLSLNSSYFADFMFTDFLSICSSTDPHIITYCN